MNYGLYNFKETNKKNKVTNFVQIIIKMLVYALLTLQYLLNYKEIPFEKILINRFKFTLISR